MNWKLTCSEDGNALEFRLNGVYLERVLKTHASKGGAMIPVMRAMRRYHPDLEKYDVTRSLWLDFFTENKFLWGMK